jgi:hypothetical protein
MQEKRPHVVSIIIGTICILAYATALGLAGYRFYVAVRDRGIQAESEFFNLSDLASSFGASGFMNEDFKRQVQKNLDSSGSLEAVIISGPSAEYAFERNRGQDVNYVGDSPRFTRKFGVSSTPFYTPLHIDGLRNVSISAVYRYINSADCIAILRDTLILVLGALALAFLTFVIDTAIAAASEKPGKVKVPREPKEKLQKAEKTQAPVQIAAATEEIPAQAESPVSDRVSDRVTDLDDFQPSLPDVPPVPQFPDMPPLDFPDFNSGSEPAAPALSAAVDNRAFEANIDTELDNAEAAGTELSVMVMNYSEGEADDIQLLKDWASDYFNNPAWIFEHGSQGLSVMVPGDDLNAAFKRAENFRNELPQSLEADNLHIGISSRSERTRSEGPGLNQRLVFEAEQALDHCDLDSPVVAFRSDPEKYRQVVAK